MGRQNLQIFALSTRLCCSCQPVGVSQQTRRKDTTCSPSNRLAEGNARVIETGEQTRTQAANQRLGPPKAVIFSHNQGATR
jgi:hypothetical protein